MFLSVHAILVFVFCSVVAIKLLSTVLWPGEKKYVKRDYYVDNLLTNVREVIDMINEDIISIQDIVISIPNDTPGQFWATSGWVGNMSSITRTNEDIDVKLDEMNEDVEFTCYLKYIKITYNHFKINISNTDYYGSIYVDVNKNLIRIKLFIDLLSTGNCTTMLSNLLLEEFSDVKINITGLESNSDLMVNVKSWVLDNTLIIVRHRIEDYLNQLFYYVLPKLDFCINKPELDEGDY